MLDMLRRIRDTFNWGLFAYRLAVFLGLTGALGSIAGGAFAVISGVPLPIALMVGYCTLVGAVYLAMAPLAFRVLAAAGVTKVQRPSPKPNYVAVRLMHEYTLSEASRLWCDIDQSGQSTRESESWSQALRAAIQRGDLAFRAKYTGREGPERRDPEWSTAIPRQALKEYAAKIKQDPRFLRDTD